MTLLPFFMAGLIIGVLRGGGLRGLVMMKIRWVWLIILSFAAERCIAYLPVSLFQATIFLLPALQLARYVPLLLFAALNIKDWRICLAGAGIAMNFAVIALNGWQMPVSWQAPLYPDIAKEVMKLQSGAVPDYMLMNEYGGASLWFLADMIPIKVFAFYPTSFISPGDILLGIGVMLAVQHGMAGYAPGKHARTSRKAKPLSQPAPSEVITREVEATAPAPTEQPEHDITLLQTAPAEMYIPQDEAGATEQPYIPVRLSPRLETIARMAERGACVADVGCDHGKLAAWLALRGVPRVIAMDVSVQSLMKTRQLVQDLELNRSVQTRVSDGLKKLRSGEADIIVMAGMGGPTMCEILAAGHAKALAADRLVLQPMNAVGAVRRWLADNGFRVTDERLAEEDSRIYQILSAVPGDDPFPPMSLFDLEVGRQLIDCRHPLLGKLLDNKIQSIDTILSEIAGNATPKASARRNELLGLRERCAEVLQWLAG